VWLYAAHNPSLKAAVAWYGPIDRPRTELQPKYPIDLATDLKAPVLGLYGGADQGIPVDGRQRDLPAAGVEQRPFPGRLVDTRRLVLEAWDRFAEDGTFDPARLPSSAIEEAAAVFVQLVCSNRGRISQPLASTSPPRNLHWNVKSRPKTEHHSLGGFGSVWLLLAVIALTLAR
jgi:Dienelactone hydrolase family